MVLNSARAVVLLEILVTGNSTRCVWHAVIVPGVPTRSGKGISVGRAVTHTPGRFHTSQFWSSNEYTHTRVPVGTGMHRIYSKYTKVPPILLPPEKNPWPV